MQKFDYYLDRKVTLWIRESHTIQAQNKAEANKQMMDKFNDDDMCIQSFNEQDIMYDTIEQLDIGDNGLRPTIEIYDEDSNFLTSNIDSTNSK